MAALKKALLTLFGGKGKVPKEGDLEAFSLRAFKQIADTVKDSADDEEEEVITGKDLYTYLMQHSVGGISQRTVDLLFKRLDLSGDGEITREEFLKALRRSHEILVKQFDWDEKMNKAVPLNHVIPGSTAMNARSGTRVFGMEVVSRSSMQHMWQIFQELDSDKDNFVSLPEFKKYMKRKQPHALPMATSIFYSMDKNRDGTISFRELLNCMFPEASQNDINILMRMARPEDFTPHVRPNQDIIDEVKAVFAVYDDDKSGALDEEEFTHALSIIGFDTTEAASIFREVDKDGSGEVSLDEFEQWYSTANHKQTQLMREVDLDSDAEEV